MDRHRIERRDFPTGRRGYDPAAVDEHLRRVADEFEAQAHAPVPSLAASTSEQVRHILEAAERGAAELRIAAGTEATAHVSRVQEAADGMLAKLNVLESELSRLMTVLRTSAERLTEGLAELQSEAAAGLTADERQVVRAEPDEVDARPSPPAADDASAAPPPLPAAATAPALDDSPPAPAAADASAAPLPAAATPRALDDSPPAPAAADASAAPLPAAATPPALDDSPPTPAPAAADESPPAPAPPARDDTPLSAGAAATPPAAEDALAAPTPPAADDAPAAADDSPAAPTPPATDTPPLSAPDAPDWPVPLGDTLFPEEPEPEPEDAGARLIALNMALNGSPRDDTRVFLEEHFDLPDVEALLDDVYARAGR